MALGVSCCILSPICLILLSGLSEYGGKHRIAANMAGGVGLAVLLLMAAAGAATLIFNGLRLGNYE